MSRYNNYIDDHWCIYIFIPENVSNDIKLYQCANVLGCWLHWVCGIGAILLTQKSSAIARWFSKLLLGAQRAGPAAQIGEAGGFNKSPWLHRSTDPNWWVQLAQPFWTSNQHAAKKLEMLADPSWKPCKCRQFRGLHCNFLESHSVYSTWSNIECRQNDKDLAIGWWDLMSSKFFCHRTYGHLLIFFTTTSRTVWHGIERIRKP